MNWLNINISTLSGEEFLGARPIDRGTWLCLLKYCAILENGGRIENCFKWSARKWSQLAGVYAKEVKRDSKLWSWEGSDIVVWGYPVSKEGEVKRLREQAKGAAERRWGSKEAMPKGNGKGIPEGIPEGNCKGNAEEKGKEGNTPIVPKGTDKNPFAMKAETKAIKAEDIYQAYPRHIGIDKAIAKIKTALKTVSADDLLEAVQAYAKSQAGRARKFIPHPATWFNGGCWKDDRAEWEAWKETDGKKPTDNETYMVGY